LAGKDDRGRIFSYLQDRFGIPEKIFDNYLLFRRRGGWQLINQDVVETPFAAQLKVSKVGLRAFQKIGKFVKPTTRFIQLFGSAATKAKLEIDESQLRRLVAGEELSMAMDLATGYVILSHRKEQVLGLGFFINGKVRSQIPKKQLKRAMLVQSLPAGLSYF
jgi:NOL1/NOP2/fmu family ribosome biogenesis protein